MLFPQSRILVFCKAPEPGKVKTRLATTIGDYAAARIHEYLARHCLQQVVEFSLAPVELWCAPDCDDDFFCEAQKVFSIPLKRQVGADLGQRMQYAMGDALSDGYSAIIIGTDCPGFTREYLHKALQAVNEEKTVIGPAEDGGYVLLGMHKLQPNLFSDISWGTPEVFEETLRRLEGDIEILSSLWDVDYVEDVCRLRVAGNSIDLDELFADYLNNLELKGCG